MSERDLEMKSFGPFEIKSEDRGEVVAIVATLGVVDKDGDVIMPGSLPREGARVKLSGYDHDTVLKSLPPVGKGVIVEEGNALVFKGQFFMSTQRGREAFLTTKEMGSDGEWSFGFSKNTKNAPLTDEWRAKGARRVIAGMKAFEASPVFMGAGWGTGTVMTKSAEDLDPEPELINPPSPEAQATLDAAVAQADGDSAVETPAEVESPEAKAAKEAELALKAQRDEAIAEYERVQRALKRMDYAA